MDPVDATHLLSTVESFVPSNMVGLFSDYLKSKRVQDDFIDAVKYVMPVARGGPSFKASCGGRLVGGGHPQIDPETKPNASWLNQRVDEMRVKL